MKFIRGKEVNDGLSPKFQMRHERFSFYDPRRSDEGADTDLLYNFCWPQVEESFSDYDIETVDYCIIVFISFNSYISQLLIFLNQPKLT